MTIGLFLGFSFLFLHVVDVLFLGFSYSFFGFVFVERKATFFLVSAKVYQLDWMTDTEDVGLGFSVG